MAWCTTYPAHGLLPEGCVSCTRASVLWCCPAVGHWSCRRSAARLLSFFFFFNDRATPEIYPLSLHDAFPISITATRLPTWAPPSLLACHRKSMASRIERKSTRLNSSHLVISYAVFCLKK